MTEPFFNRELELIDLQNAWEARGAALVTLWGRRRVGKSTLLSHFAAGKRSVYLYGTRMTERDILTDLALQASDAFSDSYLRSAPFPTWDAAPDYLAERARNERLLVVLDEFPYLCEVTHGLDTLVRRWWDRIHRSSRQWSSFLVLASPSWRVSLEHRVPCTEGARRRWRSTPLTTWMRRDSFPISLPKIRYVPMRALVACLRTFGIGLTGIP